MCKKLTWKMTEKSAVWWKFVVAVVGIVSRPASHSINTKSIFGPASANEYWGRNKLTPRDTIQDPIKTNLAICGPCCQTQLQYFPHVHLFAIILIINMFNMTSHMESSCSPVHHFISKIIAINFSKVFVLMPNLFPIF